VTAIDNARTAGIDVARIALEADALRRIPRSLAFKHDILSLSSEGNELTIAIPDTEDRDAIDRVRLVTGMHVRALCAPRESIRTRLAEAYGDAGTGFEAGGLYRGDEAPAVRALADIHTSAVTANASDIHIEPSACGGRVRERIDGMLYEARTLAPDLYAQVVSRVKLLAGMDIADRRQPQDGRYAIDVFGRAVDARVNSMPTIAGEKLAIRLLDNHACVPDFEYLGIPDRYLARFRRAVHAPHGFVVVCGPTGSGKTTTLYAAMSERNDATQNLCSVEDPVEVRIPGVAQVQINPRAGVTFAAALRSLLRQDPNVIMVGEMRDEETAAMAASASLSGQLVLATLHANDAPSALERLAELGVNRYTIAAGLTALIAQRLLRRLCAHCRLPAQAGAAAAEFGIPPGTALYRAAGCERCNGAGYLGRAAIFECLFLNDVLRAAIAGGCSNVEFARLAAECGYEPMLAEGLRRVHAGETTVEELRRVLSAESAA
jgi:type IV pilus assembly protein PilB